MAKKILVLTALLISSTNAAIMFNYGYPFRGVLLGNNNFGNDFVSNNLNRPSFSASANEPVLPTPDQRVSPISTVQPYDHNPIYGFAYTVHDSHTGDSKHQFETRHGNSIRGQYSLIEPDGSRRLVNYIAEPHSGFNAFVHRFP